MNAALAKLTPDELGEYDEATDTDCAFFLSRPDRRYRLRHAQPAEVKILKQGARRPTFVLTHIKRGALLRIPVFGQLSGDLPDDDRVLGRIAAGIPYTGHGGHA